VIPSLLHVRFISQHQVKTEDYEKGFLHNHTDDGGSTPPMTLPMRLHGATSQKALIFRQFVDYLHNY
jgi:hypothetical protein